MFSSTSANIQQQIKHFITFTPSTSDARLFESKFFISRYQLDNNLSLLYFTKHLSTLALYNFYYTLSRFTLLSVLLTFMLLSHYIVPELLHYILLNFLIFKTIISFTCYVALFYYLHLNAIRS